MFGIKDKVIVITGGSRGIGKEIGVACAALGANVILVASNEHNMTILNNDLEKRNIGCDTMAFDVRDENAVFAAVTTVVSKYGRIDGLVTGAGVTHIADAETMEMDNFKHVIDINLIGTMTCCKYFGKQMLAQKSGKIVTVSSVRGIQGKARVSAYAASKGAVTNLTRTLGVEWGIKGVNVNGIAPAFTKTDMADAFLADKESADWLISRSPMGRFGEVMDMVGPAIFLLSEASRFLSGMMIYVDGGWISG